VVWFVGARAQELFREYGEIESARVIKEKGSGKSLGEPTAGLRGPPPDGALSPVSSLPDDD
jgi:hypothetical protein